jgi:hypothetical protein
MRTDLYAERRSEEAMASSHRLSGTVTMLVLVLTFGACNEPRPQAQAAATTGVEQPATLGRNHPADGDEMNLSSEAAATLASVFRSLGLDAKQAGTAVTVAGTQVSVASRISNKVQQANRHLLAAEFDISVGGTRLPELFAGAIGIGDSPDAARDTAVAEWASQYGIPIGFAIARRLGASSLPAREDGIAKFYAKVEVDGQLLFHSPVGLRGAAKAPEAVSSDEFVRRIAIPVVASMRQRPSSGEYRSATVLLVVDATAVTEGECRIDGVISADLLRTLSKVTWPEGSPSYMFKLFFVGPAGGS